MLTDIPTLDDLDLTHCVIGGGLVLEPGPELRLYACRAGRLRLIGAFTCPAEALAALDDVRADR